MKNKIFILKNHLFKMITNLCIAFSSISLFFFIFGNINEEIRNLFIKLFDLSIQYFLVMWLITFIYNFFKKIKAQSGV